MPSVWIETSSLCVSGADFSTYATNGVVAYVSAEELSAVRTGFGDITNPELFSSTNPATAAAAAAEPIPIYSPRCFFLSEGYLYSVGFPS